MTGFVWIDIPIVFAGLSLASFAIAGLVGLGAFVVRRLFPGNPAAAVTVFAEEPPPAISDDGPYRTAAVSSIVSPAAPPSAPSNNRLAKYAALFDPKYDASYEEWVKFKGRNYKDIHDLRALFKFDIADPFKARALRDILVQHGSDKIEELPERFRGLAVDLILDAAEKVADHKDDMNSLLVQVACVSPKDAELAVDLMRGPACLLVTIMSYRELPQHLRRRLDARLRPLVRAAAEREFKRGDEAWKDQIRWMHEDGYESVFYSYANAVIGCFCEGSQVTGAPRCETSHAAMRADQVYFIADIGAPVFARFHAVFRMLKAHFDGTEHKDLRRRIFKLYAQEMIDKGWMLHDEEDWKEQWRDDFVDDPALLSTIDEALARWSNHLEENRKYSEAHAAREAEVMARMKTEAT